MPIDIKLLRDQPDVVRESQRRRFRDVGIVDAALQADVQWRSDTAALNGLRADLATTQRKISDKKKTSKGKDPCTEELAEKAGVEEKISAAETRLAEAVEARTAQLGLLGNIVDDSVPISETEEDNQLLRCHGKTTLRQDWTLGHWDVLGKLGAYDSERGTKVAGKRGYFLRDCGVVLNMALQSYGVSFLARRGYSAMQPPFFMRREIMARTAELKDFDEQLYCITAGRSGTEPAYLIATAEQPISAFHQDENIELQDLPLKYAGVSPCFRTETSSSGADAKGLFRVHQFEKVEQFCICKPEDSSELLEDMLAVSEEFYQSLGLPYRIVAIASGGLNDAASKKYDLEAWFPASGEYRELVSASNCTDFQARALGVRLAEGPGSRHAHMLNGTLCATERTLCCIAENYQTAEGIRVPQVLVPYVGDEFIRYRCE